MPMKLLRLHATHVPVQGLLQQTPSTHSPLLHSAADAHLSPFALSPDPTVAPASSRDAGPGGVGSSLDCDVLGDGVELVPFVAPTVAVRGDVGVALGDVGDVGDVGVVGVEAVGVGGG